MNGVDMTDVRTTHNYTGAAFSFLRVLAVAVASAILPLMVYNPDVGLPWAAIGIAAASAALLTVVNYFGSWETRFGTPPNPGAATGVHGDVDHELGAAALGTLGSVLLIVGAVLMIASLLLGANYLILGVIIVVVGAACLLLDRP